MIYDWPNLECQQCHEKINWVMRTQEGLKLCPKCWDEHKSFRSSLEEERERKPLRLVPRS